MKLKIKKYITCHTSITVLVTHWCAVFRARSPYKLIYALITNHVKAVF